jgi:Flp pilus assembly protein TadD
MTLQVGDKNRAIGVFSGDRILLPSAIASLAAVLDLRLSPAALKGLADGGTSSPEAEVLYLRGRGYLLQGEGGVDAAIDSLLRARQADAAFALAVAALSDAYRQKYAASRNSQFLSLAQTTGDDAIKLDASVAYAHMVRGNIYVESSQYERAIREFQAALAADPAGANARRRLAEVYEGQGSLSLAEENYRQEIALYPHYWRPLVDFGSFLIKHGRYAEAESNLLTAVQYAPGNARAIGNLAGLYALTERFFAAEAELRRGLEVAGPNAIGLNNLAWVYIYQGRMDQAAPTLEQAVKTPAADSTHWSSLARVYRWTNRRDEARTTYAIAIKRARTEVGVNPRNARIRANLASLLAETGERREALIEMASTLDRAPTDVSVLFRSAVVHELIGDRDGALKALEAAARGGYSAVEIRRYPDLARLRDDPRFLAILSLAPKPALQ